MSSGTLWSHPGSSNVGLDRGSSGNFNPHPFNTTRLESNAGSGSVVTTNPISDQHYFGVGDYESSNAADPYMVRTDWLYRIINVAPVPVVSSHITSFSYFRLIG